VRINPNVRSYLFHDSMQRWRRKVLTRDFGGTDRAGRRCLGIHIGVAEMPPINADDYSLHADVSRAESTEEGEDGETITSHDTRVQTR
jgi:hypothetical protein